MAIKLWQRKQGLMTPPEQALHAEPGSRSFPAKFRNRLIRWTPEVFHVRFPQGPYDFGDSRDMVERALGSLCHDLAEAYGRPILVTPSEFPSNTDPSLNRSADRQIPAHLVSCTDVEVLDFIDAVFQLLVQTSDGYAAIDHDVMIHAATRLNGICEEEGIGYRWTEGELIRFDDPVSHREAVQPAMELLADGQFGHANAEFRRALECYRSGEWRDAITNANAAFESVLKVATGKPNLNAGPLIAEARRQGVIPGYMQNAAEHLEKLMNVVPAIRGQEGSHGLGEREQDEKEIEHLAGLVVPTAATFIVFIGRNRS
jgi:hypothetical protein